ncbi:MAG: hypothetical protein R6V31_10245 [Halohasta sp.]
MSTHEKRLCERPKLSRAEQWAAHAAVERWIRTHDDPDSQTEVDRLLIGSQLRSRLETGRQPTRAQLSLLAERCRAGLADDTLPERDRDPLAWVLAQVEQCLDSCST